MSLHRRELIRRAAAAGTAAWIAPSVVGMDSAAAMVSCPGTATNFSFGTQFAYIAGLNCNNRRGGGYNCADTPRTTTRGTVFNLPGLLSHTTLTITGLLQLTGGWESSGNAEDMFMIHLDGVRIFCNDNLLDGLFNVSLTVPHTACDAVVQMTACVTDPGNENWRYFGLNMSVA